MYPPSTSSTLSVQDSPQESRNGFHWQHEKYSSQDDEEVWLDQVHKLRSICAFCLTRFRRRCSHILNGDDTERRPYKNLAATIMFWLILFTIALAFGLYYASLTSFRLVYNQYEVGDSTGPKRDDVLSPENTTTWLESSQYNPKDWFLRLDDQSLIPMHLVDEQELRYDQFLRTRYPEIAEVADTLAWTSPNFLQDPNALMLPVDNLFHVGHCIRTFRRYWQAKETGRHVCLVDIDYRHIWHCFTALEEHFYPMAPREEDTSSMTWRTKVCV